MERWRSSGSEVEDQNSLSLLADTIQIDNSQGHKPANGANGVGTHPAPPSRPQARQQQPRPQTARKTLQPRTDGGVAGSHRASAANSRPAEPAAAAQPATTSSALKALRDRLSQGR